MEQTEIFESNEIIKSISYDQEEIIKNIIKLYCPDGIECDPTYSKGVFYKNIQNPKYKFDLDPVREDVGKADCRDLPLRNNSLNSLMFDPPFVAAIPKKEATGIITKRFGYYRNIPTLWNMYNGALKEFHRVLKDKAILIFKCQDSIDSGKQYFSEFKIIKDALKIGFYPKDKFILLAKHRLMSPNMKVQQHCRKFHSYFLVFIKQESRVDYNTK